MSIEVVRSNWGNDYQYHAITKDEGGKQVRRTPAPEWAYVMYLRLLEAEAKVAALAPMVEGAPVAEELESEQE